MLDRINSLKKTNIGLIIDVLLAAFSFRAVSSDFLTKFADGSVQTLRIMNLILALGILSAFVLYCHEFVKKQLVIYKELFCGISALLWLIGFAFVELGGGEVLTGSLGRLFLAAVVWLGLKRGIGRVLEMVSQVVPDPVNAPNTVSDTVNNLTVNIRCFVVIGAVIFVAYLPWIIIRYPGAMECDAYYQIEQFLGYIPMNGQWPPLSCALMGGVVGLGKAVFGSYNAGAFLYVLIQTIISVCVLTYSIIAMNRMGVSRVFCTATAVVYIVSTSYASYITSIVKDTMFAVLFLLFIVLLAEILHGYDKKRFIALFAVGLIMCGLRNNGVYLVGVSLVALLIYLIKHREARVKKSIVSLVAIIILYEIYTGLVLPAFGIANSGINEALSIPFQQTARYVLEHPLDITAEERQVIDETLGFEGLAEAYNPVISDPVKSRYKEDTADLGAYLKVWGTQLIRHPGTYFAAVFDNAYGFYYPFALDTACYGVYEDLDIMQYQIPEATKPYKYLLYSYVKVIDEIPVVRLINSCGMMAWLTLLMFLYGFHKKDGRYLVIVAASFLSIFICVASPTFASNGTRYALPIIYTVPFLLGMGFFRSK